MIFEDIETGIRYKLSDFGLDLQSGHEHPSPPTRDKVLYISGKHGAWDFGADLGPRPFNLPLVVLEMTRAELQMRIRKFTSFLFNAYAQPKTFKLFFDYEMDKFYFVRFSGQIRPERLAGLGTFILPLIAHKPYAYAEMNAYDPVEVPVFGEASTEDYYANTSSFSWQYSNHYSGVHNYSSMNADFDVVIEGTVINPSITHLETNKKLSLPSLNNQKLELDSARFIVKVNGVSQLAGTDFFSLVPGDNGLLFEGESPNATVTYKWKHKFI